MDNKVQNCCLVVSVCPLLGELRHACLDGGAGFLAKAASSIKGSGPIVWEGKQMVPDP